MSVFMRGHSIHISSNADNTGVFMGQNRQDGWDSASPIKQASGFSMGDGTILATWMSGYWSYSDVHQANVDVDRKGNRSRHIMR